jgi:hypothetical protein
MVNTFSLQFSNGLLQGYGHRLVHDGFQGEPILGAGSAQAEAEPLASPKNDFCAAKRTGRKSCISLIPSEMRHFLL